MSRGVSNWHPRLGISQYVKIHSPFPVFQFCFRFVCVCAFAVFPLDASMVICSSGADLAKS